MTQTTPYGLVAIAAISIIVIGLVVAASTLALRPTAPKVAEQRFADGVRCYTYADGDAVGISCLIVPEAQR